MKTFVEEIATKIRPYLAKNGGPVILAQIENEYHGGGVNGSLYVDWCGQLAISLNFSIPWIMCNGESSNLTINTCNGNDCYSKYMAQHIKQYADQPLAWTENEGWYQTWEGGQDYNANQTGHSNRSPEDMGNVVAKWFGGGASHHNYYMYFGGNHLKNHGSSGLTNYYADGVNYHSDGLPHEPKRSHLVRLHKILADKQYIL